MPDQKCHGVKDNTCCIYTVHYLYQQMLCDRSIMYEQPLVISYSVCAC